jgi:hypothetical protein
MPSSSALIPMSFSHSFTTYEWLNRDCDAQIDIGITSRWTGYRCEEDFVLKITTKMLFSMIIFAKNCQFWLSINESFIEGQK